MNVRISSSPASLCSLKPFAAPPAHELVIGGITPFTTIDFPGRLAAVLYTQGCAWRCRYCHNSHLQPFQSDTAIPFQKVRRFLEARKGLLDGVVFCGGEPTLQPGLAQAMQQVHGLGFQVALHTTGVHSESLREVLPHCDWVGMDVKAPFCNYEKITQREQSGVEPEKSVRILLASGVDHEFRTTVHPDLLSEKDILEIARDLSGMGASRYVLQTFQPNGCSDETLKATFILENLISADLEKKLTSLFKHFEIRR